MTRADILCASVRKGAWESTFDTVCLVTVVFVFVHGYISLCFHECVRGNDFTWTHGICAARGLDS